MTSEQMQQAAAFAAERATRVSLSSPWHGPRHWRDVARIGHLVAFAAEADPQGVFLFACIHDTQRHSEYRDDAHGLRSASVFRQIIESAPGLMCADEVLHAIEAHDNGGISIYPTTGACWDADRLTLPRVGIVPDVTFFSTPHLRENFEPWCEAAKEIMGRPDLNWASIADAYESGEILDRDVLSVW